MAAKAMLSGQVASTLAGTHYSTKNPERMKCRHAADDWLNVNNIPVQKDGKKMDLHARIKWLGENPSCTPNLTITEQEGTRYLNANPSIPPNVIIEALHVLRQTGNKAAHLKSSRNDPDLIKCVVALEVLGIPPERVFKILDKRPARLPRHNKLFRLLEENKLLRE